MIIRFPNFLIFIFIGFLQQQALGESALVSIGECKLEQDPLRIAPPIAACIKGSLLNSIDFSSDYKNTSYTTYIENYISIHTSPMLSFHIETSALRIKNLTNEKELKTGDFKTGIVKIGNHSIHNFTMSLGKQPLPFGINNNPFKGKIPTFEPSLLWKTPNTSAVFSFDNQFDFKFEFGVGSNLYEKNKKRAENKAATFRIISDVSSLYGTRFIFSGYSETLGKRRYGIAVFTRSKRGEQIHVEFVRERLTPKGTAKPFNQILRIGFDSPYKNKNKWLFLYDYIRNHSRQVHLGNHFTVMDHFDLNFDLSYINSILKQTNTRWIFSIGGELKL